MTVDPLRHRWNGGAYGRLAWVSMPDGQLLELTASTGAFDAIVLDVQHGAFDRREVLDAIRCLGRWPVTVLARIPSADPDLIGWLLDAGLDGIIVAMCESADTARSIVAAVRHMPEGSRSYGVFRVRPHDVDTVQYARSVIVLPMVESAAGLTNVDDIVAVEGVDGVFIGPGDLGLSLGIGAGQNRTDPAVTAAFTTIADAAHRQGKKVGIFATTADYARATAADGYDLVVAWYDAAAISNALSTARLD
ncbi:MAG: HpcH/HpaI aldolase family protein [Ilumatobacteraceae bacterium]